MPIVVQKFGGSSVADVERIRKVAARVKARREEGNQLVVVVSAMGDTTDELLALARQVSPDPPRRELDMLLTCGERISMALMSMALQELGVPAISFTGSQSGIITTDAHAQARIVEVRPFRIQDELANGKVVIVAGYQGVSAKKEVTTLGRGGSDTTAVALAAALGAECEIYSDVDGVFSADPRVVPEATKLSELTYDEMQELACAGARVLNAQAVEFAREKGIVIAARSTFGGGTGTVVRGEAASGGSKVKGVTAEPELISLHLDGDAGALDALLDFLDARAIRGRSLLYDAGRCVIALPLQDLHGTDALTLELQGRFPTLRVATGVGTVTAVGTGMNADWSCVRRALAAAEALQATVHGVFTSALTLSLLVDRPHLTELARRLHRDLVR